MRFPRSFTGLGVSALRYVRGAMGYQARFQSNISWSAIGTSASWFCSVETSDSALKISQRRLRLSGLMFLNHWHIRRYQPLPAHFHRTVNSLRLINIDHISSDQPSNNQHCSPSKNKPSVKKECLQNMVIEKNGTKQSIIKTR